MPFDQEKEVCQADSLATPRRSKATTALTMANEGPTRVK